ncbi:MAG: hypothetical protein WCK67_00435 [bacterium]
MMLFSDFLKQQQPFITEYFESLFSVNPPKLANAYLLTGSNIMMSYYIALETARALNCKCGKNLELCNCQDGRWISQNRHPAVITVSPADFKYNENGYWVDKKSDNIKIEQARYLKNLLSTTSDFHRVVIFTGAVEGTEYANRAENEWKSFSERLYAPKSLADNADEIRNTWIPQTLSRNVLREDTANSLLKTIEEPGANITFFFLAQDKEDVIETIVSRCCVLNVASKEAGWVYSQRIVDLVSKLPVGSYGEALELAETVNTELKEGHYSLDELFDGLLHFFRQIVRSNCNDSSKIKLLHNWVIKTERTKFEIKGYASLQPALEELFSCFVS